MGLLVVIVALLAGLGYLFGKQPPENGSRFWNALAADLQEPVIALAAAAVLLLAAVCLVRLLCLERHAWTPGPIAVTKLKAPEGVPDADVELLTTRLRQHLDQLRLRSPEPLPGATAAGDFIDVLNAAADTPRSILGSLIRLLRVAFPTHAYEVTGALVAGNPPGAYGVTVQVRRAPKDAFPATTCWSSSSWSAAVEQAASAVLADVLPRTRRCRRGQWAGWRRMEMPHSLLHDYERASTLTEARRYDEALDAFYGALSRDARNIDLRLQLGFTQEKLALWLDAASTYIGASEIGDLPTSGFYNLSARRSRRAGVIVARYRLALLLAGPRFSRQWRLGSGGAPSEDDRIRTLSLHRIPELYGLLTGNGITAKMPWAVSRSSPVRPPPGTGGATTRDHQRELLRERLTPDLMDLLRASHLVTDDPQQDSPANGGPPWSAAYLTEVLGRPRNRTGAEVTWRFPPEGDDREWTRLYQLRQVLSELATRQLGALIRELKWPGRWLLRRRLQLSVGALKLARISANQQREWVTDQLERAPGGCGRKPDSDILGPAIHGVRFRSWTEHYNAACIFAAPLSLDSDDQPRVWAERAVAHLQQAIASTDSAYIAARRDWLISEDPALDGLRAQPQFQRFEARFFPSSSRTPRRPAEVHSLEMFQYVTTLLTETARRWEGVWHRRRRYLDEDIHVLLQWSRDEEDAWKLVDDVAVNHPDWRTRIRLIRAMEDWGSRYAFEALDVAVPMFLAEWLDPNGGDGRLDERAANQAALDRLDRIHRRLGTLHERLSDKKGLLRLYAGQWDVRVRDLDAHGQTLRQPYIERLCDTHAAVWQRLRECLDDSPSSGLDDDVRLDDGRDVAFRRAVQTSEDLLRGRHP